MKIDTHDYKIAGHWMSALFNSDYSGLTDEESTQLDIFIAGLPSNRIGWNIAEDEEGHFALDEISGLYAKVYDSQLVVEIKKL